MKKRSLNTIALWLVYGVFVLALSSIVLSSCSTTKGYNYGKHYKKQNRKKSINRVFDLDNCRKNNHSYKY